MDYRQAARIAAQNAGISPDLFEAQINAESSFAPDVISGQRVSSAGAKGIAQLMPLHWKYVDPSDPIASLNYAANMMANFLKAHNGNWAAALSDYNAGPSAANKSAAGVAQNTETINYVNRILGPYSGLLSPQSQAGLGGSSMPTSDTLNKIIQLHPQWRALHDLVAPYYVDGKLREGVKFINDAQGNLLVETQRYVPPTKDPITDKVIPGGMAFDTPRLVMTAAQAKAYSDLDQQYQNLLAQSKAENVDPATAIKQAEFNYNTSDASVDADNSAKRYARDLQATNAANAAATNEYSDQMTKQAKDYEQYSKYASGHMAGDIAPIPKMYLPTRDDIFKKSLETIKSLLPDVKDQPYYTPEQKAAGMGGGGLTSQQILDAINGADATYNTNQQAGAISGSILNGVNGLFGGGLPTYSLPGLGTSMGAGPVNQANDPDAPPVTQLRTNFGNLFDPGRRGIFRGGD